MLTPWFSGAAGGGGTVVPRPTPKLLKKFSLLSQLTSGLVISSVVYLLTMFLLLFKVFDTNFFKYANFIPGVLCRWATHCSRSG